MALLGHISRLLLVLSLVAAPAVASDGVQMVEQKIKAGLLYNFLKYTQWPQARATAVVCLFGGDPFDGHLAPMAGRTVNQSTIEIRQIQSVDQAPACALFFLHGDKKAAWPEIKAKLAGKDILTVSDFDGFAAEGGMIEFTRVDERIGVKINVDAVTTTHLTVEDRLLKLASAVRSSPEH